MRDLLLFLFFAVAVVSFRARVSLTPFRNMKLSVSQLEKEKTDASISNVRENIPSNLRTTSSNKLPILDPRTYESELIECWEKDVSLQKGFDWEIEKLRRYFGGLRMLPDGTWVRKPSLFAFLVSSAKKRQSQSSNAPKPVNFFDVFILTTANIINALGFGEQIGLSAVPDAVIQKYEGSFLSFIKGVLGGDLQTLAGGPLFLLLAKYYHDYGAIFNLSFGPKSFLVVSDPVMSKHILCSPPVAYCKGMLADILEPIMGKGLIPADPQTWKVRRRAIAPGFHKKWLNNMVELHADAAEKLVVFLEPYAKTKIPIDMEERFCSVTLDIIGKAVFNYDFGSVTKESPIVKSVFRILREVEHRSSSFIPYWNLPYADKWMGGQVEFRKDLGMMEDILTNLINKAILTRKEASIEELEDRTSDDPSLLRFLVDMRGDDISSKQLRDDLMTMLIAGHETTAAMLTWTLFELSQNIPCLLEIQEEISQVLGTKTRPDYDDIIKMKKLRYALTEALRLYPEPPVLIRRSRTEDKLPPGGADLGNIKILRGTDIFISTWNLHRSPELWEDPEKFDPTRWERKFTNPSVKGWEGFNPDKIFSNSLYPNEQSADYAFLPFGGGQRRCIGDQFAMLEAAVTMSIILNNYQFAFATRPEDVGMQTGATIHTMNGLNMYLEKRSSDDVKTEGWWEYQHTSRGLNTNGRPYETQEDAAWGTHRNIDKCPIKH